MLEAEYDEAAPLMRAITIEDAGGGTIVANRGRFARFGFGESLCGNAHTIEAIRLWRADCTTR